jgi:hypothetical protein
MGLPSLLTDRARELQAYGLAEGLVLGDFSFQVGTGGFNLLSPLQPLLPSGSQTALLSPVGGSRPLGLEITSGVGATMSATANPGFWQVTGLTGIVPNPYQKTLVLGGSADPLVVGSWVVAQQLSPTSLLIYNPLATTGATALTWSYRTNAIGLANPRAPSFLARLPAPEASTDGLLLGEVGIFCRVIRAPSLPLFLGEALLYCVANHAATAKFASQALVRHVCVQE